MKNIEMDINKYAVKNMSESEALFKCANSLIYNTKISRIQKKQSFVEGKKILEDAYIEIDFLTCPEYLILNALGKKARQFINMREAIVTMKEKYKTFPSIDYINSLKVTDQINITLMAYGMYKFVYFDRNIFANEGINISNIVQRYNRNHSMREFKERLRPIFHRLLGNEGAFFYGLKIRKSDFSNYELRKFIDSYNKIDSLENHLKAITAYFYTVVNNYYLPKLYVNNNESIYQIEYVDFLIKGHIFKCMHGNHKIENIVAMVNVDVNGQKEQIKIPAGYCSQCNVYFILESTYQKLKSKGIILCRITDEKIYWRRENINEMQLAQESILRQYGYSVSQTENLTSVRRQRILAFMMDNKIMSKNEIISYLDFFINQRRSLPNMGMAISKWEDDREFVENYRMEYCSKYGANAIYRK